MLTRGKLAAPSLFFRAQHGLKDESQSCTPGSVVRSTQTSCPSSIKRKRSIPLRPSLVAPALGLHLHRLLPRRPLCTPCTVAAVLQVARPRHPAAFLLLRVEAPSHACHRPLQPRLLPLSMSANAQCRPSLLCNEPAPPPPVLLAYSTSRPPSPPSVFDSHRHDASPPWVSGKTDSPRPPLSIPHLPALSSDLKRREFVLQYPLVLHRGCSEFLLFGPYEVL